MNSDVLECKRQAQELASSDQPPCYPNGRKRGYIELMRELWDEKGYGHLGLKGQNLRDQASRLEKHQENLSIDGSLIDESRMIAVNDSISIVDTTQSASSAVDTLAFSDGQSGIQNQNNEDDLFYRPNIW